MSLDPRSPSMNLWHWLLTHGASEDEATELMNRYAHELAQRQRHDHDEIGGGCYLGQCHGDTLPDIIDPEVDYDGEDAPPVDEYRLSTRPGVVSGEQ